MLKYLRWAMYGIFGFLLMNCGDKKSTNPAGGGTSSGNTSIQGNLAVSGIVETAGFKMPTGAGSGKVLKSDANGVGTWQSVTGGVGTTVYTASGTNPCALSGSNTWLDFCGDFNVTFSLSQATNVLVSYQTTTTQSGGVYTNFMTRLMIDGAEKPEGRAAAIGFNLTNNAVWLGNLTAGSHTVKVQYRTDSGLINNPGGSDIHTRTLSVLVFGS